MYDTVCTIEVKRLVCSVGMGWTQDANGFSEYNLGILCFGHAVPVQYKVDDLWRKLIYLCAFFSTLSCPWALFGVETIRSPRLSRYFWKPSDSLITRFK